MCGNFSSYCRFGLLGLPRLPYKIFSSVASKLREATPPVTSCNRSIVSCPAGNNLRKIRLVTLRAFLGLLHTSAGFERGRRWPYMDVFTSTWLQLSPISIPTSASAPVGRPSNWTCCNLIGHGQITPS